MKRKITILLSVILAVMSVLPMSACGGDGREKIRIGVLREDDTSGEARAWEQYLRTMGDALGFTVDFTTTDSSAAEVSAINTYASKGYKAILLFSDDDIVAAVNAASAKKLWIVYPTGQPTDEQYARIKDNGYYLGSVAPLPDDEYRAGYDMAAYFVEGRGQKTFTVFGGATAYGADMHIQRLTGMLTYLCSDPSTAYDGVKTREEIVKKVAGVGMDPSKLTGGTYRVTGYMDGFKFDDAFTTKLTNSLEAGGTCILSVGAGDVVSRIAYGIRSSNPKIGSFISGGVDAITSEYAESFPLGYTYDCGKYASSMAPGLILLVAALDGHRITDSTGAAPRIGSGYWVATSRDELESMLAGDNAESGYCYDEHVIRAYANGNIEQLKELCAADYETARRIHDENRPSGSATEG